MNTLKNALILAIDDDVNVLALLNKLLAKQCKQFIFQTSAQVGLNLACTEQPDLILLDVMMGQVDGYEVCEQLKADEKTAHIPVIFLSSLTETADKVKGFQVGGVDYIAKPFVIAELIARIESCLLIHQKIFLATRSNTLKNVVQDYHLSCRELGILELYISGHKRSEIAAQVNISENTVKWYLKQLFQKLEVESRAALIEKCRG